MSLLKSVPPRALRHALSRIARQQRRWSLPMHWMRNTTIRFPWKLWVATTLVGYFLQEVWLVRNWTTQADWPQVIAMTVLFAFPFLGVAAAVSFIICSILGCMGRLLSKPTPNGESPKATTRLLERLLLSTILSSLAASTFCLWREHVLVEYVHGYLPMPILWACLFVALGIAFLWAFAVWDRRRGRMGKTAGLSHSGSTLRP